MADGSNHTTLFSESLVSPASQIEASSLIPPSLKDPSTAYGALLSGQKSVQSDDKKEVFGSIHPDTTDGTTGFDDSCPVSSPDDYAAVVREAHGYWRARLKQPTGILEQAATDIRDFMAGTERRRLRLVLTQIHDLVDRTPKVYDLLGRKRILKESPVSLTRIDRSLNSTWSELKLRCSLLILDKETCHSIVHKSPLAGHDGSSDKLEHVQSLVQTAIKDIIDRCTLLWDMFETSIRGLVLISSGAATINHMWHSATQNGGGSEIQHALINVLLGSYSVMPDLYKVAIKDVIEAISVAGNPADTRILRAGLQRHRVLPSVLFRSLAYSMGIDASAASPEFSEARMFLDELFHPGAGAWIGQATSSTRRPKYVQTGAEMRDMLLLQFKTMTMSARRQNVLSYTRAVSGLIGYLRLDVSDADLEFFQSSAEVSQSRHTVEACAALYLVLVGFGAQLFTEQILCQVSDMAALAPAQLLDYLFAHLITNHVKEVEAFVSRALAMDFTYPRDRLFYLKDTDSGVDVREWITHLVRLVDADTANECGELVKAYVSAIFESAVITPIPEVILWTEFSPKAIRDPSGRHAPPSQVLLMLYLLYYCEGLAEQPKQATSTFPFASRRPTVQQLAVTTNGSQARLGQFGAFSAAPASQTGGFGLPMFGRSDSPSMSLTTGTVRRGEYSDQLLDSVPVSWILQCVGHDLQYRHLWPELLSMATAQYPDQLDVVSELQREMATAASANSYRLDLHMASLLHGHIQPNSSHSVGLPAAPAGFEIMVKLANSLVERIRCAYVGEGALDTRRLRFIIEEYLQLPISVRIETCGSLSWSLCQAAIASVADDELTACVRQVWLSLHALSPHVVSTATINAWRSGMEAAKPKLTAQDVWLDPLVVFRSDVRIFQSANLVDILLTVLGESLVLSRSTMRRIFTLRQTDSGSLKRSHMTAIIQLQESSALQMLIETVKYVSDEKVRWLVYEFIHARFLEQRTIQKLVHFQSYDTEAIYDMVDHVPSMHACSEFIPELLMQSAPRLQLFAIKLAAAITKKYPIQANEGMAKEVILPHIQTTLVQIAGTAVENQLTISNAMLSAVVDIDSSFPLIHKECNRLATAVRDAAIEKARGIPQSQQKQQLPNFAKWIGCCEHVLAIINSAETNERPEFISIENTETTDIIGKLEEKVRGDASGSRPPLLASGGGPPVPPGALRPPVPPLHPGQQQQQQQQAPGSQKRSHSMISNDRGPRAAPQRDVGGQPSTDTSRNRNGIASGVSAQQYGLQISPDAMAQQGNSSASDGNVGGVILPNGNPPVAANNPRKRNNRSRTNNTHQPRETSAGPGVGGVEGRPLPGLGNPARRGRNSSTERPRITDH
ncbi:hypothetical protein LPJ53_001098 [Coemansia erecta]|uniref:Uncharacterized protein n=1 Tax=Coemansia erecta TaxID=147472 RepID=A0A9W7Y4R5_9FUNG|nr:hypothetical protein LPJ53_001098 [Coemansia erecta]